ncbi:glyoxalase [Sulfurifustis variabilis]|uniref:Glyoxalase n=1 Tax=Sulfurifustis variabilis TaxID=1675686 RepID=A0A1B4VB91_9GAMM|nr:VOC family protein [Sulfurifustis variabilis]BAU49404.1 glyoxalase [Sulfurifustis variabilis]
MANPFVHVELNTNNLGKAKPFYENLFGWKLADVPQMNYTMVEVGEGTGGGMMEMKEQSPMWLAYVQVDDVRAATQKVKALGGSVLKDVTEVPGMGWFSVIADPTGATLGLWQSTKKS